MILATAPAAESVTSMRRSVRLASKPVTSANPATRARDTMLRKLGLTEGSEGVGSVKKQQLLLAYIGPDREVAEEAVADLLGLQAQAVLSSFAYYLLVLLFVCNGSVNQ
jgi:hypothetical protein